MHIIKMYHINTKNIKEINADMATMASVGVSQYGLEASLPKGNTISKVVENEALRRVENARFYEDIIKDVNYIQTRIDNVTDPLHKYVLVLKLDGLSNNKIADRAGVKRRQVYNILEQIAYAIKKND